MDIAAWLRQLGLEQYAKAFRDNAIDADLLPKLTANDLMELGVSLVGHRRRLLDAIALLAETEASPTPMQSVESPHSRAERRQLTVLFCDLVGSTELSGRLDPEDLGEVIRTYQNRCTDVATRWDGHVAKYMGDGVLVYFGWPRAHEDDAERAVRAGLDLTEVVATLRAEEGPPLAVRVGIATGLVMVGDLIGEGAAQEQAVVGETPNLAARLQGLAEPGQVVIAEATRRLVGAAFEFRNLGPQTVKGLAGPVAAFAVTGERATSSRFEARSGPVLSPMVGRDEELALLLERWAQAKAGDGQGVLLVGEAGIGKSRISRALLDAVADEPHTRVRYQCSPYHTDSALWPVIQQLSHTAGLGADDPVEARLDKLEALLDRVDGRDSAALIADLLGLDGAARYGPLDLTSQAQRVRTLDALVDQLLGLDARQPVLVVLEDAHWIDPTTLEMIEQGLDRIAAARVLLLVTSRPDQQPELAAHPHVTRLTLNRLDRGGVEAIVARLGGDRLPTETIGAIIARTDGVPLFVEELTKAVLEIGETTIPASLHDSLNARLDRIPEVKEVAQVAACIGREFSFSLLAAVADRPEAELASALDKLVSSELIFRRGAAPDAGYTFKHALVQDAAYQSLLKAKRRQLHASIANALEGGFPQTATTQPELLAHHCGLASLSEKAVIYWLRASKTASDRSASLEGIAHITRGLNELPAIADSAGRARLELELQAALGGLLLMTRGHAAFEVGETYSRVLELSEQLHDSKNRVSALLGLTRFHTVGGRFGRAAHFAQQLLDLAHETRDPTALVTGHYAFGVGSLQRGEVLIAHQHFVEGARLHVDLPRAMSVDVAHHPGIACVAYLAVPLWLLGYPHQALTEAQGAVSLARDLDHPFTLAFVLVVFAKLLHFRREARSAQAVADEAIAVARERGFPLWLPIAEAMQAWALATSQGERSAVQIRQGLAKREAIGAEFDTTYLLCLLADVLTSNGQNDQAFHAVTKALEVASRLGERVWEAELMRRKGEIIASLPTVGTAEAEACFRRAIETANAQGSKSLELRAATSLARFWRDQGKRREAHDVLAPIYDWFTEGFDTTDLKDAHALLDQLR
jgi:class 3 adenylate cyclase/predicted ATPase